MNDTVPTCEECGSKMLWLDGENLLPLDPEEVAAVERLREQRRRTAALVERARAKEEALRDRLIDGAYWSTADGEILRIRDQMTPRHAGRALEALMRSPDVIRLTARLVNPDGSEIPDFDVWPTLRALERRANEEPRLRDRMKDRRDTRRFEKGRRS